MGSGEMWSDDVSCNVKNGYVNQSTSDEDKEAQGMVTTLKEWICRFFAANTQITASLVGRNVLIEQVTSVFSSSFESCKTRRAINDTTFKVKAKAKDLDS